MNNKIQRIFNETKKPSEYVRSYLNYLTEVFNKIDEEKIAEFIELLKDSREKGATVYFIGNGGSAATASHFANDLCVGTCSPHKPFRAVSLTDNNAIVTAIANDFGYENIFVNQLEVLLKKDDTVVAISASGNSPNILKAIKYSQEVGARTVGISGFDGGELKVIVDLNLHVDCEIGEYGPVEDLHMIFDHIVGSYLSLWAKSN